MKALTPDEVRSLLQRGVMAVKAKPQSRRTPQQLEQRRRAIAAWRRRNPERARMSSKRSARKLAAGKFASTKRGRRFYMRWWRSEKFTYQRQPREAAATNHA